MKIIKYEKRFFCILMKKLKILNNKVINENAR